MHDFPLSLAVSLLVAASGLCTLPVPVRARPAATGAGGTGADSPDADSPSDGVSVVAYGADPTGRADSTAAIQAALDAHPYGAIVFPAQANGTPGVYRISSLRVLKTQRLVGPETTAARLRCVSRSGACIVISDPDSAYTAGGMDNIAILGPGEAGSGIGLYLGGDPQGRLSPRGNFADGEVFGNILVSGFHVGVEFGNNAWADRFAGALIIGNGTGMEAPRGVGNSGEAMALSDSTIANNGVGIEDDAGFEFFVTNAALDDNRTAIAGPGIDLHAANVHFEQGKGDFVYAPYGTVTLFMDNVTFLLDAATGTDAAMIGLWPQGADIAISGASLWSNHPVADFLYIDPHAGLPPHVALEGIDGNGNGKIAHLSNTSLGREGMERAGALRLPLATVASLPACNRAAEGELAAVSDAAAPHYDAPVRGGGTVSVPVYCNGAAWTAH